MNSNQMHVETITVGPAASNCYVLWNEDKKALIIDPGSEAETILGTIENIGLSIVGYPLTHGHVDHVSALSRVHAAHPAPIALHPEDARWAFTKRNQMAPIYDPPESPGRIDRELGDGQAWMDAGFRYEVLHTPGHTPGGVCFLFPDHNVLISGDTLFRGSVGRTDLPGGNMDVLMNSLKRLADLPEELRVFPGHGPPTTIGEERQLNPFMQNL